MNKKSQEILTYEIFEKQDSFYLSIPVNNLINPKFLIKNNNLFIFLYNYSQCYIVKKIPKSIMKEIINKNCFLRENLNQDKPVNHLIKLFN